jgi:hypothetical protein
MSSMAVCRRLKLIRFKRGWKNSAKLEAVMPQRKQSDEAAELTRQAQAQTGQAWMLVAHRSVAVPQMTRVFPRTALTLSTVALMIPCTNAAPPSPPPAPTAVSPRPAAPYARITYDARENCGREARELLRQSRGDGASKAMAVTSGDAAHYKQRSNACYLLLEVTTSEKTNILFPIVQIRAPGLGAVAR